MRAPCLGCLQRCTEPNCHMNCVSYLEYRRVKEAEYIARQKEHNVIDYIIGRVEKMQKRAMIKKPAGQ